MPTETDYTNQVPGQGEPGSDIKARNTGSSKAILAGGKENYSEPMAMLPRKPLPSHFLSMTRTIRKVCWGWDMSLKV